MQPQSTAYRVRAIWTQTDGQDEKHPGDKRQFLTISKCRPDRVDNQTKLRLALNNNTDGGAVLG